MGVLEFLGLGNFKKNRGFKNIDVSEFKRKMKGKNTVVLDVRTYPEVRRGKIKGAKQIDIRQADFSKKIQALDKNKTYLVYCRSGMRSSMACKSMVKRGFTELYNLKGGFIAWENA